MTGEASHWQMSAFTGFAVLLFLFVAILLFAAGLFLWTTKLAKIERRSYGRAVSTIFVAGVASIPFLPNIWPLMGRAGGIPYLIMNVVIMTLVTMACFRTTLGKAFRANILFWIINLFIRIGLDFLFIKLWTVR